MKIYFLFIFYFFTLSQGKDASIIHFINSYIKNEQNPTEVVVNNLGWDKHDIIELVKMSGVRHSSVFGGQKTLDDRRLLFIVDLEFCDVDALKNATNFFRSPFRWLVISKIENVKQNKFLWELPLLADSDFVLAVKHKNNFTLTELYKCSSKGPTNSMPRGYYNGTLVDTRARREMYRRRRDLQGHNLTQSFVIQDSNTSKYHMLRDDRLELQYDATTKVLGILFKEATHMLNATPQYIFSNSFGIKRNGKWTGMLNDLLEGRADIGSSCVMIFNRLEAAVFIDCLLSTDVRFIFRQPPLSEISNIFTLPLSINVWISILVCSFILIFAFYLTSKWEATYNERHQTQIDGNITDAVLLTLGAVTQQYCSIEPRNLSGRITFFLIFIFMVILHVAYNANLLGLLRAPSYSIKTLEQLADSNIKLAARNAIYNRYALKGHNDTLRESISKRIIPDQGKKMFCELEDCLEKLRKGSFAFHTIVEPINRRIEETFLENEKCDLMYIDFLQTFRGNIPVQKDSPYLEHFRVVVKQIRETGCWKAIDKRYTTPNPKCDRKAFTFITIGFQNMRPVILLLLFGVTASVVILFIEIIVHRLILKKNKRSLRD